MKQFWSLPVFLRLAIASQPHFNVLEDLQAYPQFEVIFREDSPASEDFAAAKVHSGAKPSTHSNPGTDVSIDPHRIAPESDHDGVGSSLNEDDVAGWEMMRFQEREYLCSIPRIPEDETAAVGTSANNRSAEEEKKELEQATDRGWELLKGMEGNCIYFVSGWWSYSFCYGDGVRQFHQLPPGRNVPAYPPVEDKSVQGYVLGRFDEEGALADGGRKGLDGGKAREMKESGLARLETKGEMRYLVQRLKGGTTCDLTGKERIVEVQFHCQPTSTDRISLIKETSTCQYLMVISTPRLCNDIAFLPPEESKPHAITCRRVLPQESIPSYLAEREARLAAEDAKLDDLVNELAHDVLHQLQEDLAGVPGSGSGGEHGDNDNDDNDEDGNPLAKFDLEATAADVDAAIMKTTKHRNLLPHETAGDIEIGGYNILPPGTKLERGTVAGGGAKVVATLAKSDGFVMSERELTKLNIRGKEEVNVMKGDIERVAGGRAWKLELVETAAGRELRGIIDRQDLEEGKEVLSEEDQGEDMEEGSEETYKEEL